LPVIAIHQAFAILLTALHDCPGHHLAGMQKQGLSREAAMQRFWLIDHKGLVTAVGAKECMASEWAVHAHE